MRSTSSLFGTEYDRNQLVHTHPPVTLTLYPPPSHVYKAVLCETGEKVAINVQRHAPTHTPLSPPPRTPRPPQVYKAVLRETGEEVAIKVQRPGVEPVIFRDLVIFR